MRRTASHDFRVGDWITVAEHRGQVIALADDSFMILVRWEGSRVCDWKKSEEAVYVGEAAGPHSPQGES